MDLIAAHQQGLIEQLEAEVDGLAGRASDHAQRAMVLHHLYDHSRGAHAWALAEARQSLWIAAAIARLRRRISRWGWAIRKRHEAEDALEDLAQTLGEVSRSRMVSAYSAYRLSATKALRSEAETSLPAPLLSALDQCHGARRGGENWPADSDLVLMDESESYAEASTCRHALEGAWARIEATGLGRSAKRLLGSTALARRRARDARKGWPRTDRELRGDPTLPAVFRANPAQHFYALQRALADRRRQHWRELCDLDADAVALAA